MNAQQDSNSNLNKQTSRHTLFLIKKYIDNALAMYNGNAHILITNEHMTAYTYNEMHHEVKYMTHADIHAGSHIGADTMCYIHTHLRTINYRVIHCVVTL